VNAPRRLSQALSEGDGISLLAPVADAAEAAAAEADGAEAIVIAQTVAALRKATGLPVLCRVEGSPRTALEWEGDACVLWVETTDDGERLSTLHAEAQALGLEAVVGVRKDDELAFALEHVDPEIVLLFGSGEEADPLERVLDLLPDVPAGKLAIAEVPVRSRQDILALERAGVDGVIVSAGDVSRLVGGPPPEV
jgi:indole-3-glycerol phosphate synthase